MKNLNFLLITVFFFASTSFSQPQPQKAPVNPEFIEYMEQREKGMEEKTTREGYRLGLIPSPVTYNFDNIERTRVDKEFAASYDLRVVNDGNWLTPVKDQADWGSCWTFATYGALESYALKFQGQEYDFSEQNLVTCHGFDFGPDDGGNHEFSTAYLSRWDGPVSEEDDPYGTYDENCNTGFTPLGHVNQARYLPGSNTSAFDEGIVKQAIMDYGAIYVNMRWDGNYYNPADHTFFYNGSLSTNHAVLLVGWDDNRVVTGGDNATPSESGAWIIRNSWGEEVHEEGFFYISYEDTRVLNNVAYFPSFLDYDTQAYVYYYDKLGATHYWGWGTGGEGNAHAIKKLTAAGSHQIEKIGTYVAAASSTLDMEIYENFDGTELSNLLGSMSGQECEWPGYYTFDLNTPLEVEANQEIYIKIKYNTGTTHPVPVEMAENNYSSGAVIQTGRYWISNTGATGTWIAAEEGDHPKNVSIRAYAGQHDSDDTYTLTLDASPSVGGTVTGAGNYQEGEAVSVAAIANEGYEFTNWTGDIAAITAGDENSEDITVTMPADDVELTANFMLTAATRLYVDYSATGNADGSSWEHAYPDLQDALAIAGPDSEIWIAQGIYRPTSGTDRSISFEIPDNVSVYGGFEGTESDLGERDWEENETILCGNIGDEEISTDNSYHVVKGGNSIILDGLTIQNGYADGGGDNDHGGGMFNQSGLSGILLENCVFRNNTATGSGGAIANRHAGTPTGVSDIQAVNCKFYENMAHLEAGAIGNWNTEMDLFYCTFAENSDYGTTYAGAGAVYYWGGNSGSPQVVNCTFYNNSGETTGAIHGRALGINIQVKNSLFMGNTPEDIGLTHNASASTSYSRITQSPYSDQSTNITDDPLIANYSNGIILLYEDSPLIDAGDPASPPGPDGTPANIGDFHEIFEETESIVLNIEVSPQGAGEVAGAGIYEEGDVVQISATANPFSTFVNWEAPTGSFEDENSSETTFTMPDEHVTVTANFALIDYELTVNIEPESSGTVSLDPDQDYYNMNDEIELTALPEAGYEFIEWTGNIWTITVGDADNDVVTITMPSEDIELNANFALIDYELTVNIIPESGGIVDFDPEQVYYNMGDEITLSAIAESGYEFIEWTGDVDYLNDSQTPNATLTMPADDVELTANFEIKGYKLSAYTSPAGAGSVIIDPEQEYYNIDEEVTLTAVPEAGFQFASWSGDIGTITHGDAVSNTITATIPASNVELTANFIFTEKWHITTFSSGQYHCVHTADVTGNGIDDILASKYHSSTLEIWALNDFDEWEMINSITYSRDIWDIGTGDFNENGHVDIVVALRFHGFYLSTNTGSSWESPVLLDSEYGWNVLVEDINKNGYLDILAIGDKQIFCLYGDGTGSFSKSNIYGFPRGAEEVDPNMPISGNLNLVDLNGNGNLDIAGNVRHGGWAYYPNDRLDFFIRGFLNMGTDEDGHIIWGQNASEVLGHTEHYDVNGQQRRSLVSTGSGAADLYGNGYIDMIATNTSDDLLVVFKGFDDDGKLNWEQEIIDNVPEGHYDIIYHGNSARLFDIYGNGNLDIISGNYNRGNGLNIYYGDGEGGFAHEFIETNFGISADGTQSSLSHFKSQRSISIAAPTYQEGIAIFTTDVGFSVICNIDPEGAGSVSFNPDEQYYYTGEEVELTATPEDGYVFLNWRKDGSELSSENPLSFTMPANDVAITARFIAEEASAYTLALAIAPEEGGFAIGDGQYEAGENVNINAQPAPFYEFIGWTGDVEHLDDAESPSAIVTMPADDVELTANFDLADYQLTVSITPESGGTVTSDPDQQSYNIEDHINLTAIPEDGYEFVNWTGDVEYLDDSESAFAVVTMPAGDVELTANFALQAFDLSVDVSPWGSGTVQKDPDQEQYQAGDEVTLTAVAAEGYEFAGWSGNTEHLDDPASANTQLTMPESNIALMANFVLAEYALTVSIEPEGSGAVDIEPHQDYYNMDNQIILTAIAAEGYRFVNWTDESGEEVSSDWDFLFYMPAAHVEITANFEDDDVSVDEVAGFAIYVFPNPAHNKLAVESDAEISHITLMDISGQLVKDKEVKRLYIELDVSGLPAGMYFIRIQTANGLFVKRVQIAPGF